MSLLGQIPFGSALGSPLLTEHQVTERRAAQGTQATTSTNGSAAGIPGWTRQSCLLRSETTETN
jgi:hypothetical protein